VTRLSEAGADRSALVAQLLRREPDPDAQDPGTPDQGAVI
jgi:hypothetical protein